MVKQETFNLKIVGFDSHHPHQKNIGALTQMARDLPFKQSDVSSMLTGPTKLS